MPERSSWRRCAWPWVRCGDGLAVRSALLFRRSAESTESDDRGFATAIAGLQNLLHFGAKESQYFRARLPTFTEIISCLNRISSAVETLGQTLPEEAVFAGIFARNWKRHMPPRPDV